MPFGNPLIYSSVGNAGYCTYLRVNCHRKLLWGENTLSGKNIMQRMNEASRMLTGYLCRVQ